MKTSSEIRLFFPRQQFGLSLIEVMVAMAIGVILMLGITQIFSASRAAFSSNEGLARIQENSRFAMDFLRHDLRMAGHMGCLNELAYQQRLFNHLLPAVGAPTIAEWPYRLDFPVQVHEFTGTAPGDSFTLPDPRTTPAAAAWNPPLPTPLVGQALNGSDVVVVRYLSADFARLDDVTTAPGSEVVVVNPADATYIQPGSIYGITDCKNLSLFQVNAGGSVSLGGLNQRGWDVAENGYSQFNVLHRYRFVAYFVGTGADGGPALMRRELMATGGLGRQEELVPGVESIQILLGVNFNLRDRQFGDLPDAYVTGADVENETGGAWATSVVADSSQRWASVVSYRIGMLMRNSRPGAADAPANMPNVNDTIIVPPTDGRMRQTYEAQIAIRNRVRG